MKKVTQDNDLFIEKNKKKVKEHICTEKNMMKVTDSLYDVFNMMSDGVCISDNQYNVLFANNYLVQEFGPYESKKCYEYFHDRNEVCTMCSGDAVFKGKTTHVKISNEKNKKVFDVIDALITLNDGRKVRMEIFRDISELKKIEEALKMSEKKLRLVIDNVPQLVFWKDKNSVFRGCNQAFADHIGISTPEKIIGKTDGDILVTQKQADYYRKKDRQVMETEIPELHVVESVIKSDGTEVWLDSNRIPMYNDKGDVIGVLVTVEDVTERKNMEDKQLAHLSFVDKLERINEVMRKSTGFNQMLSDVLDVVLDIFECDRAWLLFPCDPNSDTWSVPMERTRPEYPGALVLAEDIPMLPEKSDLMREALEKDDIITIDYHDPANTNEISKQFSIQSEMHMAIHPQTGKPWMFGVHQCSRWREWTDNEQDIFKEIGRRLGDGLNAMLYFKNLQASEERERAFQKKLTDLHDVSIALSECKTEDELWEQAIRLGRNKLGFDRLGIWLTTEKAGEMRPTFGTDTKGNVVDERQHTNITNSEFAMLRALEMKTPCYYRENEKIYDDDFINVIGHVACAVAPLWDGDNVIGGISTDNFIERRIITENDRELLTLFASLLGHLGTRIRNEKKRLELEREMLHGQKLESLGVLAGGIAHDFNNILMAVMGYSELVLQNLPDYSPVRDDVKEIRKAASRAVELSKQMLAYSGKGKFVIEPINLNNLVEEMSHILDVSISKKVTLKYNFENDLPMFDGDATQIRQIIMNIITNASEAIGDKNGAISISTGTLVCDNAYIDAINTTFSDGVEEPMPTGNYVYLEVSDTGCGMDAKTREKLFDPFFTTKFTGRGLGMAAVLGIVRGHKGAVKVYSEPGKGTTFKVLFKITESIRKITNENNNKIFTKDNWHGTGTILIADDEEAVCELGKRMFEMIGFKTFTAVDGQQAVDIFRDNADEIVCVILDLTMPNMSGNQAFHEIRLIRPDAKVILSSGYNEQDATQHFSGKGLSGFIQKPYSVDILLKTLREVIEAK